MQNLRIGIIGAGGAATNRHLPALKKISGVETSVIWSRDPDKATAVAAQFGIPATADSWQEITNSSELDAVIIATPPVLHLSATLRALDAGKHVLCQARMARNLGEAQQMLSAARKSDLVTALYPPRPGLKGDRVMQRLLHEEQFVGRVHEVRVNGMAWFGDGWDAFIWDSDVVGVNMLTLGDVERGGEPLAGSIGRSGGPYHHPPAKAADEDGRLGRGRCPGLGSCRSPAEVWRQRQLSFFGSCRLPSEAGDRDLRFERDSVLRSLRR